MICQDCKEKPAVYGDGITTFRCSGCQYKFQKENNPDPVQEQIVAELEAAADSFPHQNVPGLTSIVMPVYMVNYSLFHYTGNAIGSIREHTARDQYELIVIDNGSPIKPPNLQSYYADKVMVNEQNEGVTRAWNRGIRGSFGEYIVLINNDAQVFDGWLEDMKLALEQVDLVMAYPMYSNTEPFARAVESKRERDKWIDKPIEESLSDFTDFSCVAFKKSLIDDVGLFDEDFFNYCSDVEFRDRMKEFGKKFASCRRVATHHVSDATGYAVAETPEIMNKDKETYERKKQEAQSKPKPEVAVVQEMAVPNVTEALEPQFPQTPVVPPKPVAPPPPAVKRKDLIRTTETGDKLFYVKDEKAHWIRNPETLKALGFDFGQETGLTKEEFSKYERAEEINMQNVEQFKPNV